MQSLPAAPKFFSIPADHHALKAGAKLWRVYCRGGAYPTAWNEFRFYGPTGSRFDHHAYPKREQERGILYAAAGTDAVCTTIAEFFQDTGLLDRTRNDPWLASFKLAKDATLLDTGGDWPVRAGGSMAINSGSRNKAREWSRSIYRSYASVAGIWYPSSLRNQPCVALYERAEACLPKAPSFNESLANPKLFAGLTAIADWLRYDIK